MHGGHRRGLKWNEEDRTGSNVPKRMSALIKAIAHAFDQLNCYDVLDKWQSGTRVYIEITENEIRITIKKIR
jgi:hypothetical protein